MRNLISDEEQFERFVELLPPLAGDEVYFISLSARNKYLSPEERSYYGLGRSQMFSRQTYTDRDGLIRAMKRMSADLEVMRTKSGLPIPEKSLVVYANVHPSSTIKACVKFMGKINNMLLEHITAAANGKEAEMSGFRASPRHLMNFIQSSRSRKLYVDIDVDFGGSLGKAVRREELNGDLFSTNASVIGTKGGVHILVPVEEMSASISNAVKQVHGALSSCGGECQFNANGMIPVPGTKQAGKLVKFIE